MTYETRRAIIHDLLASTYGGMPNVPYVQPEYADLPPIGSGIIVKTDTDITEGEIGIIWPAPNEPGRYHCATVLWGEMDTDEDGNDIVIGGEKTSTVSPLTADMDGDIPPMAWRWLELHLEAPRDTWMFDSQVSPPALGHTLFPFIEDLEEA